MSKTSLSDSLKKELIAKAAGCCEFKGCGEYLYIENISGKKANLSEFAHVIADSPNGPRGEENSSSILKNDISNIMLLCQKHHKLIDDNPSNFKVEMLLDMKKEHENGIETYIKRIHNKSKTKIMIFKANIGNYKDIPIDVNDICKSISEHYYFIDNEIEKLCLTNSQIYDSNKLFWEMESKNLEIAFMNKIRNEIEEGKITHLSVFAIAPQPLLIKLGTLLTDINDVDIYQKHREPSTWSWQEEISTDFKIIEPKEIKNNIALVLSLSFTINDERIYDILGDNTSVWKITIDEPNPNFIRCKNQLKEFRNIMVKLYDRIKSVHGEKAIINIFPSVPLSIAIEIGRVRLPKADLPIRIYDQNNKEFVKTITIK
jgi:hypothetical protein